MSDDMLYFEQRSGQLPIWEHKCWGDVSHVFNTNTLSISVLRTQRGFRCSRHYHRHRNNTFMVLAGVLEIWIWANEADAIDHPRTPARKRVLVPEAARLTIPAPLPHLFRVLESGLVVEIYTCGLGPVDINDIVRFDEGGPDD